MKAKTGRAGRSCDVIVVGGGHAGCEAALAAARLGCATLLLTMKKENLGWLSCNPAIGGVAKGQLVKEIDALGGEMARVTDRSGIQYRTLNMSKGAAVRSSRAQVDRKLYRQAMSEVVSRQKGLKVAEGLVEDLLVEDDRIAGIKTAAGEKYLCRALVITPGTFLEGLIHIGLEHHPGGRFDEPPSVGLARSLRKLGLRLGRFKTGTTPRLDGRTIDFSVLDRQAGNPQPCPFSFWTDKITLPQVACYITYTNPRTHEIIRSGLDRSPLYTGIITGTGVRYCPSIEDKIRRFADRDRHQIFLEPEGLDTDEYYSNGTSTSLPLDIQLKMLRSIKGLERVEITRPGYGIEHDHVDPTQLRPTLETKKIAGLFLAGQINGTTGYEEAAAQGLLAGINAALQVQDRPPLVLDRSRAYIGVLIDDLVTRGTNEPYRMFTSRAEYRLLLREDNADLRLSPIGHEIGLLKDRYYKKVLSKKKALAKEEKRLNQTMIKPSPQVNAKLKEWGTAPIAKPLSLAAILRRPQIDHARLAELAKSPDGLPPALAYQAEVAVKYEGYLARQESEAQNFRKLEKARIPADFDYDAVGGLSNEVKEKLKKYRPLSAGQAGRISGVTPAAVSLLLVHLQRLRNSSAVGKSLNVSFPRKRESMDG